MFRGMGFGLFFINFDFERPFLAGGFLFLFDDGGLHLGGLRRGDGLFLPEGLCKRGEGDSLMTVLDKRDGLRSGDRLDPDRPLLEYGDGVFREDDDGDRLGGRLNGLFIFSLGDGLRCMRGLLTGDGLRSAGGEGVNRGGLLIGGEKLRPPLEIGDLFRNCCEGLLNLPPTVEVFKRSSISSLSQS